MAETAPAGATPFAAAKAFLENGQPIISLEWLDVDGRRAVDPEARDRLRIVKRINGGLKSVRIDVDDVGRLAALLPPQEELDALHG